MGGMSGLYVGLSGLQTSSNALNTTANNLANVNTDGYVRQQVVNKDRTYNDVSTSSKTTTGQYGLGVTVQTINHVRDIFLDSSYRRESGRNGFYEKMYDSVYEIETQMGNVDGIDGIAYQSSITDLVEALNEVAKVPGSQIARASLVQSASEFVSKSQAIYDGLQNYQVTLNTEITNTIDRINAIGDEIRSLNKSIAYIEAGQVEGANDLRDSRDLLLDELSTYCKISYNEDERGVVDVYIEGIHFCDEMGVNYMGKSVIDNTEFVIPIWENMNGEKVYTMAEEISTEHNTDVGSLKGLLVARGDCTPTYSSLTEPNPADYPGGETGEGYLLALDEYERYQNCYETSTLVNAMGNFDKLVNSIVEAVNDILCPETTITAADGTQYTVLDMSEASMTQDGNYGIELFTRQYCDRYTVQEIDGTEYYVRNNINTFGNYAGYDIMSLEVNKEVLKDYSQIPLTKPNGEDDYEKAEKLVTVFSEDLLRYNDSQDVMTFEEFYESIVNSVANDGYVYNNMAQNEETLAAQLDSQRQAVMGVSSDEELTNMIKYQQAYNAASRYINVVNEMIENLLYNLGA